MTALDQFAAKIHLAKTEPSTHDPKRKFVFRANPTRHLIPSTHVKDHSPLRQKTLQIKSCLAVI
jgi:hypothetical protein